MVDVLFLILKGSSCFWKDTYPYCIQHILDHVVQLIPVMTFQVNCQGSKEFIWVEQLAGAKTICNVDGVTFPFSPTPDVILHDERPRVARVPCKLHLIGIKTGRCPPNNFLSSFKCFGAVTPQLKYEWKGVIICGNPSYLASFIPSNHVPSNSLRESWIMFPFEDAFLIGKGEKNIVFFHLSSTDSSHTWSSYNNHQQPLTLELAGQAQSLLSENPSLGLVKWTHVLIVRMDVKPPGCQSKMEVKPWDP